MHCTYAASLTHSFDCLIKTSCFFLLRGIIMTQWREKQWHALQRHLLSSRASAGIVTCTSTTYYYYPLAISPVDRRRRRGSQSHFHSTSTTRFRSSVRHNFSDFSIFNLDCFDYVTDILSTSILLVNTWQWRLCSVLQERGSIFFFLSVENPICVSLPSPFQAWDWHGIISLLWFQYKM